jgi:hypothetical protein
LDHLRKNKLTGFNYDEVLTADQVELVIFTSLGLPSDFWSLFDAISHALHGDDSHMKKLVSRV